MSENQNLVDAVSENIYRVGQKPGLGILIARIVGCLFLWPCLIGVGVGLMGKISLTLWFALPAICLSLLVLFWNRTTIDVTEKFIHRRWGLGPFAFGRRAHFHEFNHVRISERPNASRSMQRFIVALVREGGSSYPVYSGTLIDVREVSTGVCQLVNLQQYDETLNESALENTVHENSTGDCDSQPDVTQPGIPEPPENSVIEILTVDDTLVIGATRPAISKTRQNQCAIAAASLALLFLVSVGLRDGIPAVLMALVFAAGLLWFVRKELAEYLPIVALREEVRIDHCSLVLNRTNEYVSNEDRFALHEIDQLSFHPARVSHGKSYRSHALIHSNGRRTEIARWMTEADKKYLVAMIKFSIAQIQTPGANTYQDSEPEFVASF